jgi:hypothetical protein
MRATSTTSTGGSSSATCRRRSSASTPSGALRTCSARRLCGRSSRPAGRLRHATCSVQHAAYDMEHATCSVQHAAQHAAYNMQRTTCSVRHATCNMKNARNVQHAACNMQHATCSKVVESALEAAFPPWARRLCCGPPHTQHQAQRRATTCNIRTTWTRGVQHATSTRGIQHATRGTRRGGTAVPPASRCVRLLR